MLPGWGSPILPGLEKLTTCQFKWVFGGFCAAQVYIKIIYTAFSNTTFKRARGGRKSSTSKAWERHRELFPGLGCLLRVQSPPGMSFGKVTRRGKRQEQLFRQPLLSAVKIDPASTCKQAAERKQEPCSNTALCLQRLAQGSTRFSLPHLAGLNINHGWQPEEALPGTEEARKEITGRKATQALLLAQPEFFLSPTFPRLAQRCPSPLLSYKLLVYECVGKVL